MRKTFKQMLAEYGAIAVVVYFTIFFSVFFGAWLAIRQGVDLAAVAARVGLGDGRLAANLGAWTVAYLFTKVLQPVRIAATLLLTPLIARVYERATGRSAGRGAVAAAAPAEAVDVRQTP